MASSSSQHLFHSTCSPLARLFHPNNTTTTTATVTGNSLLQRQPSSRSRLTMMRSTTPSSTSATASASSSTLLRPQQPSFLDRLRHHHKTLSHNNSYEKPLKLKPFVVPFLQQVRNDGTKVFNMTPRLVHYFEVNILPKPNTTTMPTSATNNHNHTLPDSRQLQQQENSTDIRFRHGRGAPECVAVGISSRDFSLHTRMPGWDSRSYGYHGDDGGVFFGTGHMLRDYGPTFGVGDVVGCGIDYHNACIFFTLNGTFLGNAWDNLNPEFFHQQWYPTVGMDTTCLVHCNFGVMIDNTSDEPFQFDLAAYIRKHHETPMLQRQQQQHC